MTLLLVCGDFALKDAEGKTIWTMDRIVAVKHGKTMPKFLVGTEGTVLDIFNKRIRIRMDKDQKIRTIETNTIKVLTHASKEIDEFEERHKDTKPPTQQPIIVTKGN